MPLVRVEVRNEYGLGMPELYRETNREDPKEVLDGVAVAGLVGILRQLGDLAEFAAEVFHGLQEQVLVTSSRSHKLIVRMHKIEAALPPLEKAILAQRSHLHFAYTAGSHWHARLRSEQNHFIYSDLPRCIMDSYEESRDPPRLHLLDKFDPGGPGSCLKRYSDPTFFKRASAGSAEAHIQSVRREKKTRRSKKKTTWLRNKEVIYDAPVSTHSGRMQSASSDVSGQSFSSRDVSTFESAIGSDMGNHSNSFDLRTGSNYIECVFHPSYSTQSEENEPKEVVNTEPKRHYSDSLDSASFNEQTGMIDDNIQNSPSEEQTAPRLSCVTWDEKTEIMETMAQPSETTETLCAHMQPEGALNFRAVDQIDFDFDDEHMPASVSGGGQPEDIDSETDYYVDALNTIESESETDLDCQTKRELQQYSSLNKAEDERPIASLSDAHSINSESNVPAYTSSNKVISGPSPNSISPEIPVEAYSSSNNEASEDKTNSAPSESNAYVQLPRMNGISLIPRSSLEILVSENGDIVDDSNVATVASIGSPSGSRESNSRAPVSDKILTTCESPKPPSVSSGVHPVMFWTNGGLLGLEPSKPPDFGVPTAARQEFVAKSKDDVAQPSSEIGILENNGDGHNHDSCSSSALTPAMEGPVNQDDLKASKQDGNSSARIFEFSNRLLVNGLRRQVSLVGDERLASSVRSDVSEQTSRPKAHQTFMGKSLKESFGSGSTVISPCSSPPLEHMKISFQPIDGFETSKLKLKFPDGSSCQESSGDMFPSFQLVPEPALLLHDSGSDSDDDTFCRSYISDDCRSHYSESNSEHWESGDSPRSKDHELNDGCKISKQSVSSSLLIVSRSSADFLDNSVLQSPFTEDGVEPSLSGRLFDLPNFDTLSASFNQELSNSDKTYFLESHFPKEPTPPLPPLPPMQWRGIKPHPDMVTEGEDALSEALNYALDLKLLAPTISQQPKPAPLKQDNYVETVEHTPKSKPDWQKLNGHREADRIADGKKMDETEDFLQQIRTKSFNLRRTATARPTFTPGAPTNFKVTAILEKANAIRQAVGSDDGTDDDNWSDT